MTSSVKPFITITFEDGSLAVVRTDPIKPSLLEVIGIFYEASRARSYADMENARSGEDRIEPPETPESPPAATSPRPRVDRAGATPELSPRQSAVLEALRSKMDEDRRVEAKAAALAGAAGIPLGSLHSVLQSLEKKLLIKTARTGSVRAPAVYEVL